MIKVEQLAIDGYDNNFAYFLIGSGSRQIYVVDPDSLEMLTSEIERNAYRPIGVLITHSHFDHLNGTPAFVERYKVPVFIHKNAKEKLALKNWKGIEVKFLVDGEKIILGGDDIKVMHTPGHIDDAVCYYLSEGQAEDGVAKIITGDTLFVGACGRADLEGSDVESLFYSLRILASYPEETAVYPGHDYGEKPVSTIGWEKQHNKYLQCKSLEEFRRLRLG